MPADTARLAARFRHFAQAECPEEPLYEALCLIVAAEPALLDLLSGASDEQQRPNLWLAAVHELLLAGARHPLADYYPSVGGTRAPDAQLADCLKAFTRQHETGLRERMRTQTTNTNEIGRCAVLWPALHAIARRSGKHRLALLDLGCSAGLNLGVDDYRCDYGDMALGATAQPGVPVVPCQRIGGLAPAVVPGLQIVQRCGIDPHPVGIDDAAALGWLRACLWPSDSVRAARFTQAVALMQQRRWPVLRVADCTAHVAEWLAGVPADVQPVVFNSWVLTYFEPAALKRHIDTVTGLVHRTGAMWLSAEGAGVRIGPIEEPPARDTRPASLWTLCSRVDGEPCFDLLARSHPHGRWMEWLDN
jgi:hypothetical protein